MKNIFAKLTQTKKTRYNSNPLAGVAQLVERNLAKVEVASSRLVSRSKFRGKPSAFPFQFQAVQSVECVLHMSIGAVAKRLCTGLQIHVGRFDSGPRLQTFQEVLCLCLQCPGGEIGRHKGLKICFVKSFSLVPPGRKVSSDNGLRTSKA